MKCDNCDAEATIHELTIRSGQKVERHLCEKCAIEQGVEVQTSTKVDEFLQKLAAAQPGAGRAAPGRREEHKCPSCGTTFAEFRQSGLMGCSDCYKSFEARLGPLLERAHEGASRHVGKVPKQALAASRKATPRAEAILGGEQERTQQAALLRKRLDEAIAAEQYERAAKIRDDLRRLEDAGPGRAARGVEETA